MELPTQVTDTGRQADLVQHTKTKIWQNITLQEGSYSHGPPLFPGVVTTDTAQSKQSYDCDENDNVNYSSTHGGTPKRERSSCMYVTPDQSGVEEQKTFHENYLWHKPVISEATANDLSDLTNDFIESVINGVKLEETSSNGNEGVEQLAPVKDVSDLYTAKIAKNKTLGSGPSMVPGAGVIPRKHKCEDCSYSTDNRSHLRRHISSVHCTVKQFSCYICNKEFSRQEKAKIHIVRVHPEVEYDKDEIRKGDLIKALEQSDAKKIEQSKLNGSPDTSLESNKNYKFGQRFEKVEEQLEERTDDSQSPNTKANKRSNRSYKDPERKFRCPKCAYVGKDVWHLKRHMNEIHERLKNFQCADCNYSTSRKHRMISHMKSHGQLRCFYCSFKSTDVNLFNSHLTECTRLHRAASYPCAVCAQPFGVRKTYAKHMMDAHGLILYMCDECLYVSLNYSEYSVHKTSHETHGLGNINEADTEKGEHYCAPCNELFPNEELLQQHVDEVHSGKVVTKTAKVCFSATYTYTLRYMHQNLN